jgi:hypothetical protein
MRFEMGLGGPISCTTTPPNFETLAEAAVQVGLTRHACARNPPQ